MKRKHLEINDSTQDPEDPEFSLLLPDKRKVLKAIEQLNFRVTPSELAAASGLSINSASFWLNKVASETRGKLEVAADGTIFYSFSRSFSNAYLQRGLRKTLLVAGTVAFHLLYWIVRISFGVALVLSVLVIIAIFVALILAALGDNNGGGGGGGHSGGGAGGGGGNLTFFNLDFLGDIFSWDYSPSSSHYPNSQPSKRRDRYGRFIEEHPKGNFFLECFSFLFGDGAPNSNLQQIRWQQIARVIKQNGGVVSAEQLAPFLDGDGSDEGMVLSALAQFNGRPKVTRSGFIVYVFPDFLDEANAPVLAPMQQENYLQEEYWKFSAFPASAWVKVLLLAGFNFAGSWWLFKHIATINTLHNLALLIDVLLTYAIVFLAIPALRFLVLAVLNHRIHERNQRRLHALEIIEKAGGDIARELQEAKEIRSQELEQIISDKSIVYSSDKDLLEQDCEHELAASIEQNSGAKPGKAAPGAAENQSGQYEAAQTLELDHSRLDQEA